MFETIASPIEMAYSELLRLHGLKPQSNHIGSLMKVRRGNVDGWVVRHWDGGKTRETWICSDHKNNESHIRKIQKELIDLKKWKRDTTDICMMLKNAGCLLPDTVTGRIVSALADSGFFNNGGILGGTQAFRHYPLMLGYIPPEGTFLTEDVDLFAPRNTTLFSFREDNIISVLEARGLEIEGCIDILERNICKWRINNEMEIEILTSRENDYKSVSRHKGLGVDVQSLRFLEFTFLNPSAAISLFREGISINVPAPERYAIHKLVVSQNRKGSCSRKRRKDLAQAEWLIRVMLEKEPYSLCTAWEEVNRRGKKWSRFVHAGLVEIPSIRDRFLAEMENLSILPYMEP